MTISNEVDALRVMGINPIRFLVVPSLVAMVVMLPALVLWASFLALLGAGLYITAELGIGMGAYIDQTIAYLDVGDLMHGLAKSVIFAVLITIVAVVNGASVRGGAEGVGRATTSSVVHAISAIVVTDMIFVYVATR
jgi:phospholipid/cholesterol/gamma-HCH transport system permease protein